MSIASGAWGLRGREAGPARPRLMLLALLALPALLAPTRTAAEPVDARAGTGGAGGHGDAGQEEGRDGGAAAAAGAGVGGPSVDGGTPEAHARPAPHRPGLRATLSPATGLATGDTATLTVEALLPSGDDVTIPTASFEAFEILDRAARREPAGDGRERHVFVLTLVALAPGDHTLGPIELRIATADGELGTATTAPLAVRVRSLVANEPNAAPKPPTAPVAVTVEDYTAAWVLGGLAAAALLVLATLVVAHRWRKRPRPAPPPVPARPAWEIAIERLGALERRRREAFATSAEVGWVDELSDVLRSFCGASFGFDGLESTTDEVVGRLRARLGDRGLALDVARVLGECDLVKFAKAVADEAHADALLAEARSIVLAAASSAATTPASPAGDAGSTPHARTGGEA